jgi:hypothetical protein
MSTTADGAGQILLPEQETDVEVRREDQDNINLFGRLNARLHEVRDERRALKVRVWQNAGILFHTNSLYKLYYLKKELDA